ncbi:gamma-glutamyltransferase, partial [Mesorhizobium sp. M1C.F.Ca.ET.176.01.1.1]|uniref:gamma-glutamyltransferase n=1 Tax=Mesorhizobium sp. M1C.F.Ca.ET.176.01.1.1 TaxID=2563922 RepID=UPI001AEED177
MTLSTNRRRSIRSLRGSGGAVARKSPGKTAQQLDEAQRRFGKLKWKQVLAPAIHYARDGFEVSEQLQQRRDAAAKEFAGKTNFDT